MYVKSVVYAFFQLAGKWLGKYYSLMLNLFFCLIWILLTPKDICNLLVLVFVKHVLRWLCFCAKPVPDFISTQVPFSLYVC